MTECHPIAGSKYELHCLMGALKRKGKEKRKEENFVSLFVCDSFFSIWWGSSGTQINLT
jgi:hypothetical protein